MTPTQTQLAIFDCELGDTGACERLLYIDKATAFWLPPPQIAATIPDRIEVGRQDCTGGNQQACIELGLLLGPERNHIAEAYDLFAQACDDGSSHACVYLSPISETITYEEFPGMTALYDNAVAACVKNDQSGCTTQARLNAQMPTVVPDRAIWYDQMVAACEANVGRACTHLSYMLSEDGVLEYETIDADFDSSPHRNRALAVKYGQMACDLGNPIGCWNTGLSYDYGEGVRTDWGTAQEYFVKACHGGYSVACEELNYETIWLRNDPIRSLRGPCDSGDFTACLFIAQQDYAPILYGPQTGADGERMAAFRHALSEICEMGSTAACGFAGVYFRSVGSIDAAQRYATAACRLQHMNGCTVLGNVLKLDRGGESDLRAAVSIHEFACNEGEWVACNNLGDSFEHGLGTQINIGRAARLYTLACENGKEIGCRNLKQLEEASP